MRSARPLFRLLVSVCFTLFIGPIRQTTAQSSSQTVNDVNASGIKPFGSAVGNDIEYVDLNNGGVNVRIPFVAKKGRGVDFDLKIPYSSKFWFIYNDPNSHLDFWGLASENDSEVGWMSRFPNLTSTWQQLVCYDPNNPDAYENRFVFQDMEGAKHSFDNDTGTPCSASLTRDYSKDMNGMMLKTPQLFGPHTLYWANGLKYKFQQSASLLPYLLDSIEDANGNIVTRTFVNGPPAGQDTETWTDALGGTVAVRKFGPGGNYTSPLGVSIGARPLTSVSFTDSNGNPQTYTLAWVAIDIFCTFTNYCATTNSYPALVLSQITLPNGQSYRFGYKDTTGAYNPGGELMRIDLPSGGYVRYEYQNVLNSENNPVRGINSCAPSALTTVDSRVVTKRVHSPDGVREDVWTYSYGRTYSSGLVAQKNTTVTNPDGNQEIYTFNRVSPQNGCLFFETSHEYRQGSTTAIKRIDQTWQYDVDWRQENINHRVVTRTVTLPQTNQVAKTAFSYDQMSSDGGSLITRGNVIQTQEYDYGTGGPGALLRTHIRSLLTTNPINGTDYINDNLHIWRLLSSEVVHTGAANGPIAAQTQYEYDNYTENLAASGATQHDPAFGTSYATRGNLTAVQRWRNTDGAWLTTRNQYDDAGNIRKSTDPLLHSTTFSYADSWGNNACAPLSGNAAAYLTSTTNALNQTTSRKYNSCTGSVASTTDANGVTTKYTYADPLDRLTMVQIAAGTPLESRTTHSYPDANTVTTNRDLNATGDGLVTSKTLADGLGRVTQTQLCEDGPTCSKLIRTATTYDGLGRAYQVYNSTRCNPPTTNCGESTWGYTTYGYDALGRTAQVTQPDGSIITTSYSGNITTVTDEAGKKRQSTTDGLGRLTQVVEDPGASPHLNYATSYSYDTLDNLTSVLQNGSRQRTFVFNSLSQLTSATNPESGAISYSYDNNGNVITKIDARGITTCFGDWNGTTCSGATGYDALNRVLKKTYSDGTPSASFTYDTASIDGHTLTNPVGRLVKAATADGKTATWNSYDQVGRIANQWQCSPLNCGATPYTKTFVYDFLGDHTSDTYSYTTGTLTISYSYDNAARPAQVTSNLVDPQHPATLATVDSSFGYWPNGAIRKITLGNGLTETAAFNNRLQPCRMNVNSTGAYFNQCSDSALNGTVQDFNYGFNFGSSDNGNVASWTATGQQTFSRSFAYDPLNRIATMQETSGNAEGCKPASSPSNPYTLSWTIDPWGNRTNQSPSAGTCSFSQAVDSNNRFFGSPYQYDAAGNMIHDASHAYTFDAENRVTQVDGGSTASYLYDADGRRVWKNVGGTTTDYLYDLSDNIFAIFGPGCTAGCWTAGAEYLNGHFLAEYANGTTYFVHKDHLGSSRLLTGLDQSVCDNYDYLPYGEQLTGGNCTILRFTGKERDSESGLDNFGKRYDSSSLGRFMTTDPVVITTERLMNPQQLNLYAYVANNPLRFIDPTGEILQCVGNADSQKQCFADLQQIAGDAANRLSMDAKTGVVSFDTKDLDLSKNAGAALVNDLVGSKNTYDFSVGPTIMTDKGPVRIDKISTNMANLPTFGDQPQIGNPPSGVSDILGLNLNNPNMTRVSNTNLKVAPEWTVAFHELAEAYEKIDGGKGGSYAAGHNAALQRELQLRDQRPYLKEYNTGAGGPANSPNPQGGIIIKK